MEEEVIPLQYLYGCCYPGINRNFVNQSVEFTNYWTEIGLQLCQHIAESTNACIIRPSAA